MDEATKKLIKELDACADRIRDIISKLSPSKRDYLRRHSEVFALLEKLVTQ